MKRNKFVDWLKQNRWTESLLAQELSISRQAVHQFCKGGGLHTKNRIRLAQLVEKTDGTDLRSLL